MASNPDSYRSYLSDPILDGAGDPEESDRELRTSSLAGTLVPGLDAIHFQITLPDGTQ